MKKLIFALLLIVPFIFTQCKSKKSTAGITKGGVEFVKSKKLNNVLEKAAAENKLVFVDFYATWCQPCKMMDKDVFTDPSVAYFFNDKFINYKVDGEKGNGANLAALYQVKAYPTLLWLDNKGRVVERKEGAAYHTELMQLANNALASVIEN